MGFKRGQKYTIAPNDLEAERKVNVELVEDFQGFPTLRVVLLKRGVSYNFPNIEDAFAFMRKFFVMDRDRTYRQQTKVAEPEPEAPKDPSRLSAKQLKEIILDMSSTREGTSAKEVMEYARIPKDDRQRLDQMFYALNKKGELWSRHSEKTGEVGKRYYNAKVHPDLVSR